MSRASWLSIGVLTLLALTGKPSRAQFNIVGPGSTPQGDFARGAGVFNMGAGLYNYYTATAASINADTWMRLNEYVFQSIRAGAARHARHLEELILKNREHYDKRLKQLLNSPEHADVERGSALNILYDRLIDPQNESALRLAPVHLSADQVRGIPFFFAQHAATISLQRLTARGQWPVGLRGEAFAVDRRAYERAVDNALELQLEGKLKLEAIQAVERAVDELFRTLDRQLTPSRDTVYMEAKKHLERLQATAELFKFKDVEPILGEIDKFSGTTVFDLIKFMERNNLRFGVAEERGDERDLYTKLYTSLRQQLDMVQPGAANPRG
jgi:hypothetical protein